MEFRYAFNGDVYTVRLDPQPDGSYQALINGREVSVVVQRSEAGQHNLLIDGERAHVYTAATRSPQTRTELRYVALVDRETYFLRLEKVTGRAQRASGGSAASGTLTAQMPGQIMSVAVAEGQMVEEGDLILLLEAMKMEIRVTAPRAGEVTQLHVTAGDQVERGQTLAEVRPADDA